MNKGKCVKFLIENDCNYTADMYDNTPLIYALNKNATQSIEEILDYAIKTDKLYNSINQDEIIKLIKSSPSNLA